ncbi:MAG: MerR family transcriptional regulator, partial [Actinomycetes bacterium]|nr:MerR family transcriptional regulator [Actinomycetes bacterium]
MSFRDYLTIGEVVQKLNAGRGDLSVSKLRYLEDEGLITPERTEGGYRKFSRADVERVELILRLQRERFLPLAVIKTKLDAFDRGLPVPEIEEIETGDVSAGQDKAVDAEASGLLATSDLTREYKIPESFMAELKRY